MQMQELQLNNQQQRQEQHQGQQQQQQQQQQQPQPQPQPLPQPADKKIPRLLQQTLFNPVSQMWEYLLQETQATPIHFQQSYYSSGSLACMLYFCLQTPMLSFPYHYIQYMVGVCKNVIGLWGHNVYCQYQVFYGGGYAGFPVYQLLAGFVLNGCVDGKFVQLREGITINSKLFGGILDGLYQILEFILKNRYIQRSQFWKIFNCFQNEKCRRRIKLYTNRSAEAIGLILGYVEGFGNGNGGIVECGAFDSQEYFKRLRKIELFQDLFKQYAMNYDEWKKRFAYNRSKITEQSYMFEFQNQKVIIRNILQTLSTFPSFLLSQHSSISSAIKTNPSLFSYLLSLPNFPSLLLTPQIIFSLVDKRNLKWLQPILQFPGMKERIWEMKFQGKTVMERLCGSYGLVHRVMEYFIAIQENDMQKKWKIPYIKNKKSRQIIMAKYKHKFDFDFQ